MSERNCPYCDADVDDTTELCFVGTDYNTSSETIEDISLCRCDKCNREFFVLVNYTFSGYSTCRRDTPEGEYYKRLLDDHKKGE